MSNIRAIRTEQTTRLLSARINELMDAEFGTPDGDELDVLTDLVELYEARHVYRRPSTGRTTRLGRTRTWIPMPSRPGAGKCSRVPTTMPLPTAYKSGTVDLEFLLKVVKLSWSECRTPARARIPREARYPSRVRRAPAAQHTWTALRWQLAGSTPVIGLTLRYDRLDHFWFCLLHELAHIGRHMDGKRDEAFSDDLSLRDVEGVRWDPKKTKQTSGLKKRSFPRPCGRRAACKTIRPRLQ